MECEGLPFLLSRTEWMNKEQVKFNITQSVEEVFLRSGVVPSCLKIKFSIVSSHWLCVLVSMCVGVSVWLGWSGIRVAGFSLQHGYHSNPTTPKLQHTWSKNNTTNMVIQQNSRKLLMMDILISETCWANKKWNKNSTWHQVGLLSCHYIH